MSMGVGLESQVTTQQALVRSDEGRPTPPRETVRAASCKAHWRWQGFATSVPVACTIALCVG